ncbi:hypothetical protein J437_LFUL002601 [Ladona fulva]|uniref:Glucose-methanol-choline oxidoreductase N-terminal domain-containing protein n=1 Tax=Ladona fulva TaxID=123851 RepID=A0A8K0JUB4_LADFU|nr:hypothetical protein J437_LFUL002601 [Ladona fulva]
MDNFNGLRLLRNQGAAALALTSELAFLTIAALDLLIYILRPDIVDIRNRPPDIGDGLLGEYDFVVIGGGSSGSVVASRLAEIPFWKILLLEAGGEETIFSDVPALGGGNVRTANDWQVEAEPHEGYCRAMSKGRCYFPQGKLLGGTSVFNGMVYVRGNRRDYDAWAAAGNPGWSYDEVLPYFKKSEDMRIERLKSSEYHGTGGPLTVEESRYYPPIIEELLKAGKELGYPDTDINGPTQMGFSRSYYTMREGLRCSTAKAFLRGKRRNLHISLKSMATRVIIDPSTNRVTGVEFDRSGRKLRVRVRKEAIVTAGALRTPQVLLLSGIGPRDHLTEMGIEVIADLAVGKNLQDHVGIGGMTFIVDDPITTVLARFNQLQTLGQLFFKNEGPYMSIGAAESSAFLHGKYSNSSDDWPDVALYTKSISEVNDGGALVRLLEGVSEEFYDAVFRPIERMDSYGIIPTLLRPRSRGSVTLKSTDPKVQPRIEPNYFSDERDLDVLADAAKFGILLSETKVMKSHGSRLNPNKFPACAQMDYTSEEYWKCAAREFSMSIWHFSGTAKMGPRSDPDSVVDHRLRVHGIEGLRVSDTSIMPTIVGANTNVPVIMIAEKCADMIKEDNLDDYKAL